MIERKRYIDRLRPFFHKDVVKVLTGLRRSGKSVLLAQVQEALRTDGADPAAMLSYNFEDLRNLPLCHAEALYHDILARLDGRTDGVCLFFDEIQEVDGWERVVNSLRVSHHADIYVTGSNAHLLSGELATLLAGRYVAFPVYPFSFAEYCAAYPGKSTDACWRSYLALGGMPFLTHLDDEAAAHQYLHRAVVNPLYGLAEPRIKPLAVDGLLQKPQHIQIQRVIQVFVIRGDNKQNDVFIVFL